MELKTIRDAFDRVVKRRKLSTGKYQVVIDTVGDEITQALSNIQSVGDQKSVINNLKRKLNTINPQEQLEQSQKELNMNLSKYTKTLDKLFDSDISKAYRNVDFDSHIVNQIILHQLYHEGRFDIADTLINEAEEPENISLRCQFTELHHMIRALRARNVVPAMSWVLVNRQKLNQSGSNLEFDLRRLQFLEILQKGDQSLALKFAKAHLTPFAPDHRNEFQQLMACFLWSGKLENSPYSDLISPTNLEAMLNELTRQFCSSIGASLKSPLGITVDAGAQALPTLLKLSDVMAAKKQKWLTMKQLPVAVEVGKEFQFHSVFVCLVSREQSSEENPPMLLPCGHVVCKQSMGKLSKNNSRTFKCPYCPHEASVGQCRQVYF